MGFGPRLDLKIQEVISNLNNTVIPRTRSWMAVPNCHNPCAVQQQERHCQACVLRIFIFFSSTFPCALSSVPLVQPICQLQVQMTAGGRLRLSEFLQLQESVLEQGVEPLCVLQMWEELCAYSLCQSRAELSQLSTLGKKPLTPALCG